MRGEPIRVRGVSCVLLAALTVGCGGAEVVVREVPEDPRGGPGTRPNLGAPLTSAEGLAAPMAAGEPLAGGDVVVQALGTSGGPWHLVPGTHLVAMSEAGGSVSLFDLDTGAIRARRRIAGLSSGTWAEVVGVSPNGRFAWIREQLGRYGTTDSPAVHVWDLARDELVRVPLSGNGTFYVTSLAGNRDGSRLAVAECMRSDVVVGVRVRRVVNPETGEQTLVRQPTMRAQVTVFDVYGDARASLPMEHCDGLSGLAFLPGTDSIVFRQAPGYDEARRGHAPPSAPAYRPYVLVAGGSEPRALPYDEAVVALAPRPTGGQLVAVEARGTASVVSLGVPEAVFPLVSITGLGDAAESLVVGYGGSGACIYVHDRASGSVSLHDAETLTVRARIDTGPGEVAVDADCSTVASLADGGQLAIFSAPFREPPNRVDLARSGALGSAGTRLGEPAVTDDGRFILMAAGERPVVYDRSDGSVHVPGAELSMLDPEQVLWSARADALLVRGERAAYTLAASGVTRHTCEYSLGAMPLTGGGFAFLGEATDGGGARVVEYEGFPVDACHVAPSFGELPRTTRIVALDAVGTSAVLVTADGLAVRSGRGAPRAVTFGDEEPFDVDALDYVRVALAPNGRVAYVSADRRAGVVDLARARFTAVEGCDSGDDFTVASADGRGFYQVCGEEVRSLPLRGGAATPVDLEGAFVIWNGRDATYVMDDLDGGVVRIRRLAGARATVVSEQALPADDDGYVVEPERLDDPRDVPELLVVRPGNAEPYVVDTRGPALLGFRGDVRAVVRDRLGRATEVLACRGGQLRRFDAAGAGDARASYGPCDDSTRAYVAPDGTRVAVVRSSAVEVRSLADGSQLAIAQGAWGAEGTLEVLVTAGDGRTHVLGTHFARRAEGDARTATVVPIDSPGAQASAALSAAFPTR